MPATLTGHLTTAQAAKLVGVTESTIWQWVRRGHLRAAARLRLGRRVVAYYRLQDVSDCAEGRRTAAQRQAIDDTWAEVDRVVALSAVEL